MVKVKRPTKKDQLMVAAQLLFDCQMEATYHYEDYDIDDYLKKIKIARDFVNLVEQSDDVKLLHAIIDDCIFAINNSSDDEYIAAQFEAAINYIDKFCD